MIIIVTTYYNNNSNNDNTDDDDNNNNNNNNNNNDNNGIWQWTFHEVALFALRFQVELEFRVSPENCTNTQ